MANRTANTPAAQRRFLRDLHSGPHLYATVKKKKIPLFYHHISNLLWGYIHTMPTHSENNQNVAIRNFSQCSLLTGTNRIWNDRKARCDRSLSNLCDKEVLNFDDREINFFTLPPPFPNWLLYPVAMPLCKPTKYDQRGISLIRKSVRDPSRKTGFYGFWINCPWKQKDFTKNLRDFLEARCIST